MERGNEMKFEINTKFDPGDNAFAVMLAANPTSKYLVYPAKILAPMGTFSAIASHRVIWYRVEIDDKFYPGFDEFEEVEEKYLFRTKEEAQACSDRMNASLTKMFARRPF